MVSRAERTSTAIRAASQSSFQAVFMFSRPHPIVPRDPLVSPASAAAYAMKPALRRRIGRWASILSATMLPGAALAGLVAWELSTSTLQARLFSDIARRSSFEVQPGPATDIRFPVAGPYDKRLGYSRIPAFVDRLTAADFKIEAQARFSPDLMRVVDWGLFPPYREKMQAGLRLLDRGGTVLFAAARPQRIYPDFESVPPLVLESLLFVENRELLRPGAPSLNPAVEWDRLAKAAVEFGRELADPTYNAPGGSTLATQLEKARHSPDGVTRGVRDKLRQMASASLRAYLAGENTLAARRRIAVDYLNALPLAAIPGRGEVIGLAAGLEAWFGTDFDMANRLLAARDADVAPADRAARAGIYKQVLSLLIAQRRPTYYLLSGRDALETATDAHLRLLARAGAISEQLRDDALAAPLTFRGPSDDPMLRVPWENKAATVLRARMVPLLGLSGLYELDQLDLTVESTLDQAAQEAVTAALRSLNDPAQAAAAGLKAYRLLERGDPASITYSFSLYERGPGANLLRVQTNNTDQPFNVAEGAKLDLGSTAKLRTLISYLEIIAALHERFGGMTREELRAVTGEPPDRLTKWALEYLSAAPGSGLAAMLDAALARPYSADPGELFFTGGGLHRFGNFDRADDGRAMSVREAFRRSVNLVFVRLMRDVVNYHKFRVPGSTATLLQDPEDPRRKLYLERFADREGRIFLERFYRKHHGRTPEEMLERLLSGTRLTPQRLAAVLRFVAPEESLADITMRFQTYLPEAAFDEALLARLYDRFAEDRYDLMDRGYIAGLHPLELWLVRYLRDHPQAGVAEMLEASAAERVAVYRWLFNTRHKSAQDSRIRTIQEIEAFLEIHRGWRRLGYPFESLVPSYATALGSSADRPAALAELVGILVNDGVRYPTQRFERLRFAEGTPYETVIVPARPDGERVLAPEVAAAARRVLIETVEQGTAKRLAGAFRRADGNPIAVGGKTGTGDHRERAFGPGLRLIAERVVSRTATFVFLIDDRFFGVVTAHVEGAEAAGYGFTSALPVQILRLLVPALQPLIERPDGPTSTAGTEAPVPGAG